MIKRFNKDESGNSVENFSGQPELKRAYKYNAEGQIIEAWEHEMLTQMYEHNQYGDVISIANMSDNSICNITLIYDHAGNWVERTSCGNYGIFYNYLTAEQIYTGICYDGYEYIRRIIEYYE